MGARSILVAENEPIIAIDLCDTVEEAGFRVEGPHRDIASAMLAFQKQRPDVAILDVSLDDGIVYPLAQKMAEENVPIIFHSGRHTRKDIEANFPDALTLLKPCPPSDIIETLAKALGSKVLNAPVTS